MAELYIAREGFVTTRRDRKEFVHAGDVVWDDSWAYAAHPDAFRLLEIRHSGPKARPQHAPQSSSHSHSSSTHASKSESSERSPAKTDDSAKSQSQKADDKSTKSNK